MKIIGFFLLMIFDYQNDYQIVQKKFLPINADRQWHNLDFKKFIKPTARESAIACLSFMNVQFMR
jgi:hypothetical protein